VTDSEVHEQIPIFVFPSCQEQNIGSADSRNVRQVNFQSANSGGSYTSWQRKSRMVEAAMRMTYAVGLNGSRID
jgi:hypothetical protein